MSFQGYLYPPAFFDVGDGEHGARVPAQFIGVHQVTDDFHRFPGCCCSFQGQLRQFRPDDTAFYWQYNWSVAAIGHIVGDGYLMLVDAAGNVAGYIGFVENFSGGVAVGFRRLGDDGAAEKRDSFTGQMFGVRHIHVVMGAIVCQIFVVAQEYGAVFGGLFAGNNRRTALHNNGRASCIVGCRRWLG